MAMLAVSDALAVVLKQARPLEPEEVALGPTALGRILAESVASDIDAPPFDKALMDGYAVSAADCQRAPIALQVIEEIGAGHVPTQPVGAGQAARIMTGAPMPAGADCVVKVEQTQRHGDRMEFNGPAPKAGAHVLQRGREMRAGEVALAAGTRLGPQELGVLAGVGRTSAHLYRTPQLALMTTGDEVIEPPAVPGPGQIRNSNSPMLMAQAVRAGAEPQYFGIARDNRESLQAHIEAGLKNADMLVLSGGVSAGTYDLVPGVLQELGVVPHFHKIAMKPGKPLFFGSRDGRLVFGLPGNPVSSFVCFELFIRPAIRAQRGVKDPTPPRAKFLLANDFRADNDRPTYHPARLELGDWGMCVRPLAWFGSADLRGILGANALIELPSGAHSFGEGDEVSAILMDGPFAASAHD
jgi:molybdopterin molybdotransferase